MWGERYLSEFSNVWITPYLDSQLIVKFQVWILSIIHVDVSMLLMYGESPFIPLD